MTNSREDRETRQMTNAREDKQRSNYKIAKGQNTVQERTAKGQVAKIR